jgi:dihydroneopterin aldolase
MDTVFIKGLKAASVIGCYDWERDIRQTLVIDLELKTDFARAAETDALSHALDYAAISKRVIAVCDESQFQLLEALAERLAAILLAEFAITKLCMTITKPGAVPEAEGVGVVITREKPLAG